MNTNNELTVTPESVATAGAISYWRLSGPVSLEQLAAAWGRMNLDGTLLPKPPADEVALGRAVREQACKRRLVRPLARRGAWAIVDETVSQDGTLDYAVMLSVTWHQHMVQFGRPAVYTRQADDIETAIRTDFERHRGELAPEDISAWLIKLADSNNAVTLRDTGGIYFVPRTSMPFWRSVVDALESVSAHRVFKIPAMKNSEAIDAITEAVTAEATRLYDTMMAELERTGDERLGTRALATRASECQAMLGKVQSYEQLLGVLMPRIVGHIEELSASVAAAALLASADATERAA